MNKFKHAVCAMLSCILLFSIDMTIYAETRWVNIEGDMFAVDSFNGVDAVYTSQKNDGADVVYSCAAYVKKYYKQIYGLDVYNLMGEGPPLIREGGASLMMVDSPKQGDIIFYPESTNGNNHSAIVKDVSGENITLVEQNYKTGTLAAVGRTITYPSNKYQIWRLSGKYSEMIPTSNDFKGVKTAEEINMIIDKTVIPIICSEMEFETVKEVNGTHDNPEIIFGAGNDVTSYGISGDTKYVFTIDDANVYGWYIDKNDNWVRANNGDTIAATTAYFNIIHNNSSNNDNESVDVFLPTNEDDIIDNTTKKPVVKEINFNDLNKSHWAYDSISRCIQGGIFSGYEDGSFKPDSTVSRAEFAVLISKVMKADSTYPVKSSFLDVADNAWYSGGVEYSKGYMPGDLVPGGGYVFRPTEPAKREEICMAVVKMSGFDNTVTDLTVLDKFNDKNSISVNYQSYVSSAVTLGIISGFNDGTFKGQDPITRAQAAVILDKISR